MVEEDDAPEAAGAAAAGAGAEASESISLLLLHESVRVLLDAGERLRLPQETIATAVIVFHRFFAERSLSDYQASQRLDVVLMTCLFLAAKVEEQPRRIRDAINCVYFARKQLEAIRTATAANEKEGGKEGGRNGRDARQQDEERRRGAADTSTAAPPAVEAEDAILPLDRGYWEMKESVVDTEQLVLRVLGFDLDTYQPYRLLLNYARSLRARPVMVEVAWALLNDSLFSPACCLMKPPQSRAVAALHLAQRFLVVQEQQEEEKAEKKQQQQQQQEKREQQQQQQQQQETSTTLQSSSSSSSMGRKHTFVISSSKSCRNTSNELTVDREMWTVLGAKAEDVEACCHELLILYEGGIGLSPPQGDKGGEGMGRREGGNGAVVGMEVI